MQTMRLPINHKRQRGAVAVLIGILSIVLVGFAALAIDVGYLMTTRNELQNVADAAALAAARQLGVNYQTMNGISANAQETYDCAASAAFPCSQLVGIAQAVALENQAAGINISVAANDVAIGRWNQSNSPRFTAGTARPLAVRVTARRDSISNNPVTTFLASVIGHETMGVSAFATASLQGMGTANPGNLELPVGISKWWFDNNACNDLIAFSPANDPASCAGWTSWDYNSNDANLRKILNEHQGYESPEMNSDETFLNYIGGDLSAPTFDALESLFQRKGYDIDINGDPILDANGEPVTDATGMPGAVPLFDSSGVRLLYPDGTPRNQHEWETTVVVYDREDCSNPNQAIIIAGFAPVTIQEVLPAPDKSIKGIVECFKVSPDNVRGGGGPFGIVGPIPNLVE